MEAIDLSVEHAYIFIKTASDLGIDKLYVTCKDGLNLIGFQDPYFFVHINLELARCDEGLEVGIDCHKLARGLSIFESIGAEYVTLTITDKEAILKGDKLTYRFRLDKPDKELLRKLETLKEKSKSFVKAEITLKDIDIGIKKLKSAPEGYIVTYFDKIYFVAEEGGEYSVYDVFNIYYSPINKINKKLPDKPCIIRSKILEALINAVPYKNIDAILYYGENTFCIIEISNLLGSMKIYIPEAQVPDIFEFIKKWEEESEKAEPLDTLYYFDEYNKVIRAIKPRFVGFPKATFIDGTGYQLADGSYVILDIDAIIFEKRYSSKERPERIDITIFQNEWYDLDLKFYDIIVGKPTLQFSAKNNKLYADGVEVGDKITVREVTVSRIHPRYNFVIEQYEVGNLLNILTTNAEYIAVVHKKNDDKLYIIPLKSLSADDLDTLGYFVTYCDPDIETIFNVFAINKRVKKTGLTGKKYAIVGIQPDKYLAVQFVRVKKDDCFILVTYIFYVLPDYSYDATKIYELKKAIFTRLYGEFEEEEEKKEKVEVVEEVKEEVKEEMKEAVKKEEEEEEEREKEVEEKKEEVKAVEEKVVEAEEVKEVPVEEKVEEKTTPITELKEEKKEEKVEDKVEEFLTNIIKDKLTYFVKIQLLSKGLDVDISNKIVSEILSDEISNLAKKIANKEITQKVAEDMLQTNIQSYLDIIQYVIDKLKYYAKVKLLERKKQMPIIENIVDNLSELITDLAIKVATKQITQETAERIIDEKLDKIDEKKEEEKEVNEIEDEKEKEVKKFRKDSSYIVDLYDVASKLSEEYAKLLREKGYSEYEIEKILEDVKYDIDALANDVVTGKMSLEEALERVKSIPPSIQPHTPTPTISTPAPTEREQRIEKLGETIWNKYLYELLTFGLNYIYNEYGGEIGILERDLDKLAEYLTTKLRTAGYEMRSYGNRNKTFRYVIAGEVLIKHANKIVFEGLLHVTSRAVASYIPTIKRKFRHVYEAIINSGVQGCFAKAICGVIYSYLNIPKPKWPEDIIICYDLLGKVGGS